MTDLQHKQFEFAGIVFGWSAPQLEVEEHERPDHESENQDTGRFAGDSYGFGVDRVLPQPWRWSVFTMDRDYETSLAAVRTLERAWRDERIRRTPNLVVPLRYAERRLVDGEYVVETRVIFGRPRRFEVSNEAGLSDQGRFRIDMDFQPADTLTYGDGISATTIVAPQAIDRGFLVPFEAPLYTTEPPEPVANIVPPTGGDAAAPFEVQFTGPIVDPVLRGSSGWAIEYRGQIPAGETVTVSTYPWGLRATRQDGANVSGRLSATTRLAKIRIAAAGESLQYDGQDTTGSSACIVRWRDAHTTS